MQIRSVKYGSIRFGLYEFSDLIFVNGFRFVPIQIRSNPNFIQSVESYGIIYWLHTYWVYILVLLYCGELGEDVCRGGAVQRNLL